MESKLGWRICWILLVDLVHCLYAENEDITETELSNTIMTVDPEVTTPVRLSQLLNSIASQNDVPLDQNHFVVPYQVIDTTSRSLVKNGYDPYFLNDVLIQGPTVSLFRDAVCNQVLLEDGKLFGMSDFRSVEDTQLSEDPSQLWLIWKHLRVTYRVTVDNEGLKYFGDLDTKVGRLLMHIQAPSMLSNGPKIEVSKVRTFESKVTGLEMVSDDVKRAICVQAESRIRNVLNGKVRNILMKYIQRNLSEDSSDNELMPLTMSAKFYEVHF